MVLRKCESDVEVLLEIYADRACELPSGIEDPQAILDGGANVGYSPRYFATRYPGSIVIAVEPNRESARIAWRNTGHLGDRVRVVEAALWSEDGFVRMVNPEDQSWAHRFESAGPDEPGAVPCRTIASLLRTEGVASADVVKLDIEGAERSVFADGDLAWLDSIRVLIVETHGEEIDALVRSEIERRGFKCWAQGEKLVATR